MRSVLVIAVIAIGAADARACPEVVVPLDTKDPAFKSAAWRGALRAYKGRRHKRALASLRRTGSRLQADVTRLFHPGQDAPPVANKVIQRWLQKHVHTRFPGLMIHSDRFTYPAIVWWAWADAACRAGAYMEASVALERLRDLRPGADLLHHEILIRIRTSRIDAARDLLRQAPPDAFLTPYLEGLLARASGDEAQARQKLLEAKKASDLDDQRRAVEKALQR